MDQNPDKDPAAAQSEQVSTPEASLNPVETLPYRLGFEETEELRQIRAEVVAAMGEGSARTTREAWLKYVEAADPSVESSDPQRTNRARTGLTIAQALIHLEAGDTIGYLYQLLIADETARNSGWADIEAVTGHELRIRGTQAEYRQAQGMYEALIGDYDTAELKFEEAIGIYVEAESAADPEDAHTLGVLNLRLSECYRELLDIGRGDSEELRPLVYASLQTAAVSLDENDPQFPRVMGAINDLSQNQWWQDLVES